MKKLLPLLLMLIGVVQIVMAILEIQLPLLTLAFGAVMLLWGIHTLLSAK